MPTRAELEVLQEEYERKMNARKRSMKQKKFVTLKKPTDLLNQKEYQCRSLRRVDKAF